MVSIVCKVDRSARPCVTGARTVNTGVQPLAHLCGAEVMTGVTGRFLDWGMKTSRLIKLRPVSMEMYPTQSKVAAPTTADAAQRKKLYEQTAAVMREMRAKYGSANAPAKQI